MSSADQAIGSLEFALTITRIEVGGGGSTGGS
jgi:hypothetical protein